MPRYQFQLETLRKLRLQERDARSVKLAEAFRAEEILLERCAEVKDEIVTLRQQQQEIVVSQSPDVAQLLESQRYQASLETQVRTMRDQAATLQQEIERRRLALVEADREVRVLDKLDERRFAEYQLAAQRAEAKVLDEVGTNMVGGERQ
ncbi:MAG: flagellar export protein FliJ [Lacipirellulaceae bacterium]